jgi:hypothetical protein
MEKPGGSSDRPALSFWAQDLLDLEMEVKMPCNVCGTECPECRIKLKVERLKSALEHVYAAAELLLYDTEGVNSGGQVEDFYQRAIALESDLKVAVGLDKAWRPK